MKEILPDLITFMLIILGCCLGIALIVLAVAPIKLSSVGTGYHTGYITAVDKSGYIYQNYKVYFKSDNQSSQEDNYCIFRDNEELAKMATQVSKSRELVQIKYHGVRGYSLSICDGSEITEIKTVN